MTCSNTENATPSLVDDARCGKGLVRLFASNPVRRGGTAGSYPLVLNAIVNFDRLDAWPVKP